MRRALGLFCLGMAATTAAVSADEAEVAWSAVSGAGCERIVAQGDASSGFALKVPAGSLSSCGVASTAPRAMAGRRVSLSATFRAATGDTPDVVLMLTQFKDGKVAWHQFVTGSITAGVASLELRSAVLPDIDSVAVSVQAAHAASPVDVTDLALAATGAPDAPMSRDARIYLDMVLATIVARSIAIDPASRDALIRNARFLAGGATRPADTYDAIRFVLAQIGDGHSRFMEPATASAWHSLVLKPPYGIERAAFGTIGYLRVSGFSSLDPRERSAYARFLGWSVRAAIDGGPAGEDVDGLVVDLRGNDGGSWVAMRDGLCALFDPGRALGAFESRSGRRDDWTCPREAPAIAMSHGRSGTIPIAVLIGPHTASAGEMVAIALAGRERTVSIGAATGGFTTGVEVVPLSDGAMLALATSVSVGRDGRRYPHGVVPGIAVAGAVDATSDPTDGAVATAIEWITTHRARHDVAAHRTPHPP